MQAWTLHQFTCGKKKLLHFNFFENGEELPFQSIDNNERKKKHTQFWKKYEDEENILENKNKLCKRKTKLKDIDKSFKYKKVLRHT